MASPQTEKKGKVLLAYSGGLGESPVPPSAQGATAKPWLNTLVQTHHVFSPGYLNKATKSLLSWLMLVRRRCVNLTTEPITAADYHQDFEAARAKALKCGASKFYLEASFLILPSLLSARVRLT